MSALTTYTRKTTERIEAEVSTLDELFVHAAQAGSDGLTVEWFDFQGRRHRFAVLYSGESTGLKP